LSLETSTHVSHTRHFQQNALNSTRPQTRHRSASARKAGRRRDYDARAGKRFHRRRRESQNYNYAVTTKSSKSQVLHTSDVLAFTLSLQRFPHPRGVASVVTQTRKNHKKMSTHTLERRREKCPIERATRTRVRLGSRLESRDPSARVVR